MKTGEEIEELKRQWVREPHWDIERTEGFEDHFDELLAFSNEYWDKVKRESAEMDRQLREINPHANNYPHHCMENGSLSVDRNRAGISIRAYLAGKAMQGILASYIVDPTDRGYIQTVAEGAVMMADALIEELNK